MMMKRNVLVLNFDFTPLGTCSIERAFLLVYLGKAEQLNAFKEAQLRTVSAVFEVPAVLRVQRYVNIPYRGVVLSRQNIFKRDNHTCQYCGTHKDLTIDHVIPKSKGGNSSWSNLVTACKRCNSIKGDGKPEVLGMKLLSKPRKPSYSSFLKNQNGLCQAEWLPFLEGLKAS